MRPSKLLVSLSLITLIVPIQTALAQNSYLNEPGIPAFTTSFPVEHGFINLANGNLHIEIPIADYPQRGNIKALHARLVYDSRFWAVNTDQVQGTLMWRPSGVPPVGVNIGGGFRLITDGESGNTSFSQSSRVDCYINQQPQYLTTYSNFTYQEPNGTKHGGGGAFKLYYNPSNCPGQQTTPSGTAYARGYKFVVTNSTGSISTSVFAPDGTQVAIPGAGLGSAMVQDTNGNFFTATAGQNVTYRNVIDTLGRTPAVTTFSGTQVFLDYLCVPATAGCNASNGNRARVTINTAAPNWATQFNQSGVNDYSGPGSALTSIVFPDGSQYQFQQDSYGMITSMTLPTGGRISYGYTNETDYQGNVNRWVTSMTVDGNTWNFNVVPVVGSCTATPCTQQITVTTPPYNDGTTTASDSHVYTFAVLATTAWVNQIQYFRGPPSGSAVLTKTVDYGSSGACPAAAGYVDAASLPIRETLIWPNGSGTLNKKVEYCYDNYSNVTATKMWDYQPNGSFAANPDRELDTSYVTDPSYIGANLIQLPLTTTTLGPGGVQMAQTTHGYDSGTLQPSHVTTNLNTPTTPRGNLTSVSRWLNTGGTVTTSRAWYDSGEVYQAKDALLNTTATYTYDSAGAYPSQVCNAKSQCSYSAYDFNAGVLTTFTDANGTSLGDPAHTTTHTYDSMLRPLCTNLPDGGQTCVAYPDPNHIAHSTKVTSGLTDSSEMVFDDLGRVSQTQHTLPNCVSKVDTTYDAVGAVATVTNPYCTTSDLTYGLTQTFHDALGRTVQTIKQDGSVASASYSVNTQGTNGPCVTFTDEAGNPRKSCTDASGRLIEVDEPSSTPYVTLYQYDGLGNLLRVDQKGSAPGDSTQWRTRLFTYDSLSRLLTAYNPESGTISYSYDANGNVKTKTAPAANQTGSATVTTTYAYDALNRMTSKTYSDSTAGVTYGYDVGCCGVNPQNGVGRMTYTMSGNTELVYVYDPIGRITEQADCPPSGIQRGYCYAFYAYYDLAGDLTYLSYPDGQTAISYTPDSAGRDVSAVDNAGLKYVNSATYGPDSSLTGFISGQTGTFAGITNSFSYNKRLQPVFMSASIPGQTVFSIGYDFHAGNGTAGSGSDNGNVYALTNNRDHTRDQTFTYDALNRLISAQNAGTDCTRKTLNPNQTEYWGNSYGYDAWGNLLTKSQTKCSAENLSETADAQNRMHAVSGTDYSYDAAGNMTGDVTFGHSYAYDAENRVLHVDSTAASYTYNSLGNRVRKDVNGGASTEYFYFNGQIVAELNSATGAFTNYVFFGGDRVARRDGTTGPVSYYFSDHLKTASVITDAAGNIKSESDYYPWGGELPFVANDSNHYKFTGKERDSETQLDYFGARYYSNGLGRFVTPDWAAKAVAVPYANFGSPQSLNLYSYVKNNPTTMGDPDGHQDGTVGLPPLCGLCYLVVKAYHEIRNDPKQAAADAGKATQAFVQNAINLLPIGDNKPSPGVNVPPAVVPAPDSAVGALTTGGLAAGTAMLPVPKGAGAAGGLEDSALVVRGGVPTAANLTKGAESVAADGTLQGISVQSANGATVEQLSQGLPNNQIGVTTVGEVRAAGGEVVQTPQPGNPCHCDMNGVTAEQGSNLLKVQPNPSKIKKPNE